MADSIYLLRHAQSRPNPGLDESDWPLSRLGREQAVALPILMADLRIDFIYSSPYRRALETARPLARARGLEIGVEEGLKEKKLSQGMIPDFLEVSRRAWQDFDFAFPGCESSSQCQQRMLRTLQTVAARHPGRQLLLSSHGNAIGLTLNALDPEFGFQHWQRMGNPDLFRIYRQGNGFVRDRNFRMQPFHPSS